MVAFPQPDGGDAERIDGSPAVSLHDSAADVDALLRAIFDSSYFMPHPEPVKLSVILGILRLSHKYDIQYLHRRALNHLSARYFAASAEDYRSPAAEARRKDEEAVSLLFVIQAAVEVGAL
ncbi:hypothetical protein B0H16DRAFT_330905 [Mycena metata]|uniref:Uncharacterized protein n=1 Tax=Mycena metata TaxID=1033252 RepID=A0AAD7MNE2_9AGAR|nr:hypothetical protein B0H16DRAFT_330905 [Mycena metata]